MHEKAITLCLLIIAVIHIIPISGFFGAERLQALYGLPVTDPSLEILLRHRAVLFGILGVFFAYAAFVPQLQPLAFITAFATLASFFYLSFSVADYNIAIRKIIIGDIVAAVSLLIAVVLYYLKGSH